MSKHTIKICINNVPTVAEVDTGCPIVLIGAQLYRQHFSNIHLKHLTRNLVDASGNQLGTLGCFKATVATSSRSTPADVVVQATNRHTLIGTQALDNLFPNWRKPFEVNSIKNDEDVGVNIKNKFKNIVDKNFQTPIKNFIVDLHLKENFVPIFAKARDIPYRLQDTAYRLLDDLVTKGIIAPIKSSEPLAWASPIVLVKKQNGTYRLCIDPKHTLNPNLVEDHYPLPTIDDLLVHVGGHKFYSVIDMTGAFQQLKLSAKSSKLVTISTPFGAYEFRRLPFGIKTASAVFQRVIGEILSPFPWAKAYIDDIIVFADSEQEMAQRLDILFLKLSEFNVKINIEKSTFFKQEITYLGNIISKSGIKPSPDRVKDILAAEPPKNVKELQTFLGIAGHLRKFAPRFSPVLSPLFELLKKDVSYQWGVSQNESFEKVKILIEKSGFLIHYNSKKDAIICTDASDDGISAVLCHEIDGELRPIYFKSRKLLSAEKNYPILHRELLAVVYGMEEFYKYIFGKQVILFTDHKPLIPIITKGLNLATVANRVQRYLLRLSIFDIKPYYKPGKFNALADFPSRFPSSFSTPSQADEEEEKFATTINSIEDRQPLNLQKIREHTICDPILSKLIKHRENLDLNKHTELKVFASVLDNLYIGNDLITCDGRIVIPTSLQSRILDILHNDHIGRYCQNQTSG